MITAKDMIHAEGVSILLKDAATGDLVFKNTTSSSEYSLIGHRVPHGKGIAGRVAQSGEILVVNDVRGHNDFFSGIDKLTSFNTRNIIALPMIVLNELVGVLEIVNSLKSDIFTSQDTEKALYIASQAAIAITNRRLIDDLNNRVRELESLYEISQTITLLDSYDAIIEKILVTVTEKLNITAAALVVFDEPNDCFRVKFSSGFIELTTDDTVLRDSVVKLVWESGETIWSEDSSSETLMSFLHGSRKVVSNNFIVSPVLVDDQCNSVMILNQKKDGSAFGDFDVKLAAIICSNIADLKIKAEHQKEKEQQQTLEREISIAAAIQMSSLPDIPETFNGHELHVTYHPAKVVGGDFYDFSYYDDDSYGIMVADISGKGIPAAVFMGASRNIIRSEKMNVAQPHILLANANREICRESKSSMFITLFYAYINTVERKMVYCSAGHNAQILARTKAGTVERLKTRGRALGFIEESVFEPGELYFEQGDILCLFTDGVVEQLGGYDLDIVEGEKKLIEILMDMKKDPLEDIAHKLQTVDHAVKVRESLIDDFTLLLIRL